jgi:small conductance mechanosensitive channel
MTEELEQLQAVYNMLVEFFVTYSFQLVGAVIVFLIGLFVASRVGKWVLKLCISKDLDITLSRFTASFVKIAILVGVGVIALGKLGISVTPFVAAIGAISLGAGLAMQGLLSNYGAGLNIIIARPFVVGDTIFVQGVAGQVDEVHLGYTILKTEDDVRIMIPNRHIVGEILHNSQENSLIETSVGISYASDVDMAVALILKAIEEEGIATNDSMQVGIDNFADSGITIGIRVWVPTCRLHELRFKTNNTIFQALKREGVDIPYPQREVRIHKD